MTVEGSASSTSGRCFHWASAGVPVLARKLHAHASLGRSCCGGALRNRHAGRSFEDNKSLLFRRSSESLTTSSSTYRSEGTVDHGYPSRRRDTSVETEAAKKIQRYLHKNFFSPSAASPAGCSSLYNKLKRPLSRRSYKHDTTKGSCSVKRSRPLKTTESTRGPGTRTPSTSSNNSGSGSDRRTDDLMAVARVESYSENNIIDAISTVEKEIQNEMMNIFPVRQHIHIYLPEDNDRCERFL